MACTAQMSMESNCPCHSWLRRSQLIVASAQHVLALLKGTAPITLNLSHLYNRGKWTEFRTEEPRHTQRIIRFLMCNIIHCS